MFFPPHVFREVLNRAFLLTAIEFDQLRAIAYPVFPELIGLRLEYGFFALRIQASKEHKLFSTE